MFKKIFSLFFIIAAFHISCVTGQSYPSVYVDCAPQLQKSIMTILQLPEGKALISAIQKEGPIRIRTSQYCLAQQFGAFWDPDHRIIYVNHGQQGGEGAVIGSLLFELHNALGNSKINHLDSLATTRKIDKNSYIEAMEYLEYQNSIQAAKIAEKGIALGLFPANARLPTYSSFEEHYRYQKIGGHSAWFGRNYDELSM